MKDLNNIGFSLLEILLSAVIFVTSVAGIFATLNAVRGPVANKENQLAAAVFGKQVLESLYSQVGNATYYTNTCSGGTSLAFDLSVCLHQVNQATLPAGLNWPAVLSAAPCSTSPTLSYTVSCADGTTTTCVPPGGSNPGMARMVNLNINWPNVMTGLCS